jgi:anti-sigma regulatory factor (Ser/Thr protein kinase)
MMNAASERTEASLPPEPRSVAEARRLVSATLDRLGCSQLEMTATLLVSELVTNALLHARTAMQVRVERLPDCIRITVTDESAVPPAMRRYGRTSTTGRGLRLVASMSKSWGVEAAGRGGKAVWFTLDPDAEVEPDLDLWADEL